MKTKIENKINEILQRYYHEGEDEHYSPHRENDEIKAVTEISEFLASVGVPYNVDYTDAFANCAYECGVLSIAWFCDGGLHHVTLLCEEYY